MHSVGDDFRVESSEDLDIRIGLGRRLRRIRKEKGMTMVVLGQASQCSQSFLSKVESGLLCPSLPMLYRLSRALGIKPSSLLNGIEQVIGDRVERRVIAREQEP